jgi:hypothetical protein
VVLSERSPQDITQIAGFISAECQMWQHQWDCDNSAFAGARCRLCNIRPDLQRLGKGAFTGSSLEVVRVPDSITDIGADCFADCRQRLDVTLGLGVRALPMGLFEGSFRLRQLIVASVIEGVGRRALFGAKALRGFDFSRLAPQAVIWGGAFSGGGLLSLRLPGDADRDCGSGAFSRCKLLREATIGLARIPSELFGGCTALTSVTLTAHMSVIGAYAFKGCSSLHHINLSSFSPDAEIGEKAFAESGLVEVNFPANLRRIEGEAFKGCVSLVSVRLPQKWGALGRGVFVGCTSLRALAIGDVGRWEEPISLLGERRLELIGRQFDNLPDGWRRRRTSSVLPLLGECWVDSRSGLSD